MTTRTQERIYNALALASMGVILATIINAHALLRYIVQ